MVSLVTLFKPINFSLATKLKPFNPLELEIANIRLQPKVEGVAELRRGYHGAWSSK